MARTVFVRALATVRQVRRHPTAMLERPGFVLRWFFRSFFAPIAFPPDMADKIRFWEVVEMEVPD